MKFLSVFLSFNIIFFSLSPVLAAESNDDTPISNRRIQVVACSGDDFVAIKSGTHSEINKRLGFGTAPGDSYTITSAMTNSATVNASASILEGLLSYGISTTVSSTDSIGHTVHNNSGVTAEAALWLFYDNYNIIQLTYIGNGTCEVYKSTVKVPSYFVYGFTNCY